MKLHERVRRGAMLLMRCDQANPITEDMYRCADEVEKLEDEVETRRQRHRTAKRRYQIIQRLRGENNKLRDQIKKKDLKILNLEDQLRSYILNGGRN